MEKKTVGLVCFGEINTPYERLQLKHDEVVSKLAGLDGDFIDCGIVIDDPAYEAANAAIAKLKAQEFETLLVCVMGWVPTHAVIKVTDHFRHLPMILWGLCGWKENGRIITTAEQAGTTALRPTFQEMHYRFKYIYNVIGEEWPLGSIQSFVDAAHAAASLRDARLGTMGYRDMLLYGTQYEGFSLRREIGVEVEPFEMLEMVQNIEKLDPAEVAEGVRYVKENWVIDPPCEDETIIEKGVKYALAVGKKIKERHLEAVTLIDVDGMKKLCGFPPAMVFMLLEHFYGVLTIPENDVMGGVTQLIMKKLSGQNVPYMEYYEFFKDSMLIGVPDFIPEPAIDGDVKMMSVAFGLLDASLLNVSKVKTGYVTCARLVFTDGQYKMHFYTGEAKTPPAWNEFGWDDPAPQLSSLQVFPDSCSVEEFAQKVSCQHVIVTYGDYTEQIRDFCTILGIAIL
ncbi:MAG: hypothetical protein IJL72_03745 [Lachnospiraceae bacterium]|nr:hypothetical protein [Lachnospiraceae bacterium]